MTYAELDALKLRAKELEANEPIEMRMAFSERMTKHFRCLRIDIVMDRLEKFLDKQEQQPVPEVIPQPIELVHPEDLDEVLEEMATSGLISAPQMRRIVNAVRPILEENARLKAGL